MGEHFTCLASSVTMKFEVYPHISGADRYLRLLCHGRSLPNSFSCYYQPKDLGRQNNQVVVYRAG